MITTENLNSCILGNQDKIKKFMRILNKKQDGNVWLIQGPKGIGKATLITDLCSKRLKVSKFNGKDIIDSDFFLINQKDTKKKFIPVEEVRKISKFFSTTSSNKEKIALIDSVSELNNYGHNSLLKVLENFPSDSYIFLIDHMTHKLPTTIKSRCKTLKLQNLEEKDLYKVLKTKTDIKDQDMITFYSKLSNGSVGEALNLYENDSKKIFDALCAFIINIKAANIAMLDKHIITLKDMSNKTKFVSIFFKLYILILVKSLKLKSNITPTYLYETEKNAVEKICTEVSFDNIFLVLEYAQNLNSDINDYNIEIKNSIYTSLIKLKNIFN